MLDHRRIGGSCGRWRHRLGIAVLGLAPRGNVVRPRGRPLFQPAGVPRPCLPHDGLLQLAVIHRDLWYADVLPIPRVPWLCSQHAIQVLRERRSVRFLRPAAVLLSVHEHLVVPKRALL